MFVDILTFGCRSENTFSHICCSSSIKCLTLHGITEVRVPHDLLKIYIKSPYPLLNATAFLIVSSRCGRSYRYFPYSPKTNLEFIHVHSTCFCYLGPHFVRKVSLDRNALRQVRARVCVFNQRQVLAL